jgi:pimeloyl-ACP methyl ester carboxylesterase
MGTDLPSISEDVVDLLGWPTDTVSIDWVNHQEAVHTILVFLPGNPGCAAWYIPLLLTLVSKLGPGFCARAVSYAGHSAYHPENTVVEINDPRRDAKIAWTVNGQILHKEAFLNKIWKEEKLIFISHSIGSHMVERLCVQRPDILQSTSCVIHLMPFIQMNPVSKFDKRKLHFGASNPKIPISIANTAMKILRTLPLKSLDRLLVLLKVFEDPGGRRLTTHLLRQPAFAHNFFELGAEEIRDVPEELDAAALNLIASICPIYCVYCDNDQWSPKSQAIEIQKQTRTIQPISTHVLPSHSHDFVSSDQMVPPIMEWCHDAIQQSSRLTPRSRL